MDAIKTFFGLQPFIVIKCYRKNHSLYQSLTVSGGTGARQATYTCTKVPNGRTIPISERAYGNLQQLVEQCGMHNFENDDKFGDSLEPQDYIKIEVDTKTGRKKIHVEHSCPAILFVFANNAIAIALGNESSSMGVNKLSKVDYPYKWYN